MVEAVIKMLINVAFRQVLLRTVWIQVLYAVSRWRRFVGRSGKKAWKLTRALETCQKLQETHHREIQSNTTAI